MRRRFHDLRRAERDDEETDGPSGVPQRGVQLREQVDRGQCGHIVVAYDDLQDPPVSHVSDGTKARWGDPNSAA